MQLLRTILIILLIYYAFKLISRYVAPYLVKNFIKRKQKKYYQQYDYPEKKAGEVNIKFTPEKKQQLDNLGEYIDYEEIKE